jgi:hypothetical protein
MHADESKGESRAKARGIVEEYAGESAAELPVFAYAGFLLSYLGLFGGALLAGSRRGLLPKTIRPADVILLGIATHRVSRILTRDRITTPLRIPFTRFEGTGGAGEVNERARGRGLQRALGSLLTCQFCMGPWVAACFTAALVARPRETRVAGGALAVMTVSDFLHQAYAWIRHASD